MPATARGASTPPLRRVRRIGRTLEAAIRIGNDTDTVAAIAGGLLGGRYGAGSVPQAWREAVHGWPHADDGSPADATTLSGWAAAGLNHR